MDCFLLLKGNSAALARLKAYEGIPPPYDKIKKMVMPDALKVLRLQAGHKYCLLGNLSSGLDGTTMTHYQVASFLSSVVSCAHCVQELEKKRKERSQIV
ncbi:hypothetical protein M0R45_024341 [Rubus argutus]|uniref:Uncharacterized protein n=1 Tax=Rubus argutus TaxID=59490 RepID=A0AAW1WSW7_RUBAR